MKARDMVPGTRVEITGLPFKGRTGVIRGKSRFGLMTVYEIWCDHPDALGRQLVRVRPSEVQPYQEPPGSASAPPRYGPNVGA